MSATLNGIVREKLGTRYARVLRLQGRIPASIQGEGKENLHLSLDQDQFLAARRHHEHLFDIELDRGAAEVGMVRELQYDLLGERIVHVEFRRVVRGRKTEAEVELEFTGHPRGGVLNHLMTHITVEALPAAIPDSIEIRVDELEPGHPLRVRDIRLPEGVTTSLDPDAQVAVVVQARGEAELEPSEGEGEGEAAAAAAPEPPSED